MDNKRDIVGKRTVYPSLFEPLSITTNYKNSFLPHKIRDRDLLPGGISTIENQSAIQSILESHSGAETISSQVDDDVFQCGKCKKQFTSLTLFVNHKQSRCTLTVPRSSFQPSVLQGLGTNTLNATMTQTIQKSPLTQVSLPSFTTVSQSTLNQLAPSMVLGEDQILTYSDLGTTVQNGIIQGSTLHLTGNTVGPFLSQVSQLAPRPANSNVTILSPLPSTTSLASSNGTTLTSTVSVNNLQSLVQPTQQITIATPLPEIKPAGPTVIKPNIIKPGRKSGAGALITCSLDDADSSSRRRPRISAGMADDAGKKKLACNYCGKDFTKNFDLQQHIRSHTGERPFQCVVCGRAFAQKSNVKKHMATHKVWPSGPGTTLPDQPPALLVPVDDSQKAEVTITTPALPEPAAEEQEPITQDGNNTGENCNEQQTATETTQNYKLKVIIDNSYLCQYCPEKFKSYYLLKSHMVKHKNVQVYKCVVKNCGLVFKDLDAFLEHTTAHTDELTYRCHQCSKAFSSLYELGVHQYTHTMYQHTNKSGPRHFQCNKCLNKYSTPEALEHHINTTDHKFPCPHCQKNFTSERFLRRHLVFHGTEGQFQCQVCQKTFKTEHYLKNHALIHTGEKPFECEECGAKFNRKDKLKRHNLIHDKRIRYRCPFKTVSGCEKEFNRPDKLKAHIITHSGVKPFACQICGKEFGRRPHLKEHERAHREEYPYKCTKCNRGFFRPKIFKEHKCEDANGQLIRKRMFQPRRMKRKPGRPRKIVRKHGLDGQTIIINSTKKADSERIVVQRNVDEDQELCQKNGNSAETVTNPETNTRDDENNMCETDIFSKIETCSTVTIHGDNMEIPTLANTVHIADSDNNEDQQDIHPKTKKIKQECYVKTPPASLVPVPVSVVERYVTVHLTNTGQADLGEVQAQLIPAGDFGQLQFSTALQNGQIQITPSSTAPTFHPLHIIEGQPVTLTVSQQDQLNALNVNESGVIDIPVDIVTISDDRGLVCTQEVTNTGDSGEQTYTIGDYGTEGDVVLQGSENLINGSVEILGPDQVAAMTQC